MLFVANTKGQAEDTVWRAFLDRIDSSPWFKTYHAWLTESAKATGSKPLFDVKDTFVWYGHKKILAEMLTTNIKSSRGRTTILSMTDEIALLDAGTAAKDGGGVLTNAEETHNSLAQSNETIRNAALRLREAGSNNVPTGVDINVSSPWSATDVMMRLIRASSTIPSICAFHYPTWEVNPFITYESLAAKRAANPKAFDRDFGAIPPMADSAFMDNETLVHAAVKAKKENILGWSTMREKLDENETIWLSVKPAKRDLVTPRILCVDPGESNNSFALVLASLGENNSVQIDGVLECQPEQRADGTFNRVNFPKMFDQCMKPILDNFNVRKVVSDHWQSADFIQRIRNEYKHIKAETYTLSFEDFHTIRSTWYDDRVHMPATERSFEEFKRTHEQLEEFVRGFPVLKLLVQAMTVREVGRRIVKPQRGSDDIFRAAALCITYLQNPDENQEFIGNHVRGSSPRGTRALGAVRTSRTVKTTQAFTGTGSRAGVRKDRPRNRANQRSATSGQRTGTGLVGMGGNSPSVWRR
jgi:hypothetical protein